jgi:hypothetical protein
MATTSLSSSSQRTDRMSTPTFEGSRPCSGRTRSTRATVGRAPILIVSGSSQKVSKVAQVFGLATKPLVHAVFEPSRRGDSNPGPPPYHGGALPAELRRRERRMLVHRRRSQCDLPLEMPRSALKFMGRFSAVSGGVMGANCPRTPVKPSHPRHDNSSNYGTRPTRRPPMPSTVRKGPAVRVRCRAWTALLLGAPKASRRCPGLRA